MQAYSTPMTPPPTTIRVRGMSGICRIWSLLTMVRPFSGTLSETAGLVPVAMMMMGASRSACPREFSVRTCVASTKLALRVQHLDAVARELRLGDVGFGLDHLVARGNPGPPW